MLLITCFVVEFMFFSCSSATCALSLTGWRTSCASPALAVQGPPGSPHRTRFSGLSASTLNIPRTLPLSAPSPASLLVPPISASVCSLPTFRSLCYRRADPPAFPLIKMAFSDNDELSPVPTKITFLINSYTNLKNVKALCLINIQSQLQIQ